MNPFIKKRQSFSSNDNLIIFWWENSDLGRFDLTSNEKEFVKKSIKSQDEIVFINQYKRLIFILNPKKQKDIYKNIEEIRVLGSKIYDKIKNENSFTIVDLENNKEKTLALLEGIALSNYSFVKYKTKITKPKINKIYLCSSLSENKIKEFNNLVSSVHLTRDLINEPFSHLTAVDLANTAKKIGNQYKIKTTVFDKKKIEKLKMGGLLAVNKGSLDEPTFTIMEWKPKKPLNKKPIVLIGKGIVYDTGGLSLKPTPNSMDMMKVDMGGAGVVIGSMMAIASNKLNIYAIGLIPATDNRPSGNAYAPGDVITMYNKKTVEVLNTDAEGRLILADALSYATQYKPSLVIDLATLTGAAARAIGHYGIVSMHKNATDQHKALKHVGKLTYERLAEMPFWDEYDQLIESDIADIKNLGGATAGAITAGKFLANFISYPWIHLDIAGPTFVKNKYNYRGVGATGVGVRLLYYYIKNKFVSEK